MRGRREIAGCRVLVTGASSGIGAALARRLATQRARVLLTARRAPRLKAIVDEIRLSGGEAESVAGDLTRPDVRQQLVDWMQSSWDGCDVLVNNAGLGAVGPFAEASPARLRRLMEVNFFAPVELARACLPLLRRGQRPVIVNMGSVLGHVAVPDKSEYCASKFALRGWNDAVRFELASVIDVLLVSPSTTMTEFFTSLVESPGELAVNRRQMRPDDVAHAVIRALRLGRQELVLPVSGRALVRAGRWVPGLLRPFLSRARWTSSGRTPAS